MVLRPRDASVRVNASARISSPRLPGCSALSGHTSAQPNATCPPLSQPRATPRHRVRYGIALGPDGTLFVADSGNHRIRAVSQQGDVKTFAGNGHAGYKDGTGSSAQFYYPVGIAVDADGTVFVTDRANHRVRKITSKGTVSTLAGNGRNAVVDGKGQSACFAWPHAITLVRRRARCRLVAPRPLLSCHSSPVVWCGAQDPTGRGPIYVSDTFSFRIRRIQRDGQTRTLAIGKAPPPAPAKVPPAPAAPAEASASAMSADATGTAEAPAVPATAEQAPSKAHGGAEAPPCPPEANPNGTAVEASTGAPPALDGPVPMEQESTVSAGAKEVDGCSAPDAAAPKADGAAAPAEPLAAAAASSAAVPNGDAESEDAHEAGVMPPAEQPVKQEAAEAPPADVPIPAPPPPATSASAADAPPEASSSELSTSAAPESATAAASQVGEGAAATTSWAPPSQPTAEAPTGPSAGAHAPAAAPALPSATAMPAAEGAPPTEGAQPTGAAAPAPTEAAAPSEPPGVAKPADAAMAPAAAPAPAPAAASAAPAEPVRTSLISTDEHAINGLIFLTLDAERSLLYVSEQSNHRVRCLSINGPVTMTS